MQLRDGLLHLFAKIPILDKRDIAAKVAGTALAAKAHGRCPRQGKPFHGRALYLNPIPLRNIQIIGRLAKMIKNDVDIKLVQIF